MSSTENAYARFPGSPLEHRLVPGTKTTRCGKDATVAHRYPMLTRKNSAVRTVRRQCDKCRKDA